VRGIDTGFALSFRSPKVQGIIRAAFLTINTIAMSRAIGMNRAAVAYGAELPLFLWFLARSLARCQDFVPILIALFHSIHLALVLRAIWVAGFFAKPLRRGAGSEIEPGATHQSYFGSGKVPKNVSVLTFPLLRSRVVMVATCCVALTVTTRSVEKSVSMKPIGLPLLSLETIIASLLESLYEQKFFSVMRVFTGAFVIGCPCAARLSRTIPPNGRYGLRDVRRGSERTNW
jgi:hypothetical protein